jgi:acetylornithine deacetylase/succinyl-diaminopimelate desuccinylase-like protein
MRPRDEPSVIAAGADLILRLQQLEQRLARKSDPLAGSESVVVGQIHGGEIYNQYPQECWIQGTRRWLPGGSRATVEGELCDLMAETAQATGTSIDLDFTFIRDAFRLEENDPLVGAFQQAHQELSHRTLSVGPKLFVDDGNSFYGLGGVPAITHGPRSGGQHTVHEWVVIDDMVRIAHLYALIAVLYCPAS